MLPQLHDGLSTTPVGPGAAGGKGAGGIMDTERKPGGRVKHIRLGRELSLREFAQRAHVNFNALKRFEDGGVVMSDTALRILAEAGIEMRECEHRWETRCAFCGAVR